MFKITFLLITCAVISSHCHLRKDLSPNFFRLEDDQEFPSIDDFSVYSHRDNVIEDVFLRLYTGKTTKEYADIRLQRSLEIYKQSAFRKDNPTILYIHGYKETPEQESVQVMVSSYLETRPEYNVILLDWSNMAFGSYFINAAPNTQKVAYYTALELKKIIDNGFKSSLLHVIGHSLGGQIAGFIGNELQKLGVEKLLRITALDPAFPQFYPGFLMRHITADDAEMVDIIHTDAGAYGAPVRTGSIDFWPNGGTAKQPGCPRFTFVPLSDDDLCSHWRSWRFYAESVRFPEAFPAVPAKSYKDFKKEFTPNNKSNDIVFMGYKTSPSSKGDYYLNTNGASPFGKGMDGTYHQRK